MASNPHPARVGHLPAGYSHTMEVAMTFVMWAESRGLKITRDAIMARFGVSKATANRWLNAWRDARARVFP